MSYTTITTGSVNLHPLSEDEATLLSQVIDIDGEDNVILARDEARNASGRVIGEHLTITDHAWESVQDALAAQPQD